MRLHDISVPLIQDLPTWPGEEGLRRTLVATQPNDPATVSHLAFGAHSGTHVDAPVHFLLDGEGLESFPLESFIGPCFVADLVHVTSLVSGDDLEDAAVPDDVERILALTRNSGWSRRDQTFRPDYVAFDLSAAEWCMDRGVILLGNDYLSVEAYHTEDHQVHKTLLGGGVAILEGLDLDGVSPGRYELSAFPIHIPGSDGSPVRAVLIER